MQLFTLDNFTPKIPPLATELQLLFVPNRGGSLRASMLMPSAAGSKRQRIAGSPGVEPNVVVFPLDAALTGQSLQIGIHTLTDLPSPALFVFALGPDLARVAMPSGAPLTHNHDGFDYEDFVGPAAQVAFGPGDYRTALDASLDSEPDPAIRKYRRYFTRLEGASNPSLLPQTLPIRAHIEAVMPTLRRRARARAVRFKRDNAAAREPMLHRPTAALKESVELLSRLQLELIDGTFKTAAGKFDAAALEEAYELFANGSLRRKVIAPKLTSLGYWITQPSSAFQVFFAEFAFLAIECGVDAERWLELANVMTRTQEVYLRAYRPRRPRDPGFAHFVAENYRDKQKVSKAHVMQLRHDLHGVAIERLYSFSARTALEKMPRFARP